VASGTHSEKVTQKANRVVPLAAAFAAMLPLAALLGVVATVVATVNRLAGPVWMPASAAVAAVGVATAWQTWGAPRWGRQTQIEPLPDGMEVIEPRGSARRLAIKMSGSLLMPLFLGAVRRHSLPSDLLLTAAAPAFYGWLAGSVLVISRRVEHADRQHHVTLLAAAGPFEACGGKRRLFAAKPPLPQR
jgi:hypothetical protein